MWPRCSLSLRRAPGDSQALSAILRFLSVVSRKPLAHLLSLSAVLRKPSAASRKPCAVRRTGFSDSQSSSPFLQFSSANAQLTFLNLQFSSADLQEPSASSRKPSADRRNRTAKCCRAFSRRVYLPVSARPPPGASISSRSRISQSRPVLALRRVVRRASIRKENDHVVP